MAAIRYGATPQEWDTFGAFSLPMLPVVSNPNLPTSPDSKIPPENRGKVPSKVNGRGQVVGISEWTTKQLNPALLDNMKLNPDLGFCVIAGHGTVAIDVDVADAEQAALIQRAIIASIGDVPVRRRSNSAKFLVPLKVPGAIAKQIITTAAGKIELLGQGQQFVACGTHPSGVRYEWSWPAGAPALPELTLAAWNALVAMLAQRFGDKPLTTGARSVERPKEQGTLQVHTDEDAAVARAKDWLRGHPPAIQGQGGDAHTYATVCRVRDFGVPGERAVEALEEWDERCSPPWGDELQTKVTNAYQYAQDAAGKLTPEGLGFRVVESEQSKAQWADPLPGSDAAEARAAVFGDAAASGRYPRRERLSDVPIVDGNGNFVDGLCNLGELFQVIGAPGGRKSQAAGWLAYCVATGREWLGRKTARGAVLYIAAERKGEQVKRMRVWAAADKLDVKALPLDVMGPGGMLTDKGFADHICAEVRALAEQTSQRVVLVVIDTVMATLPGADVNASGPASLFAHNAKMIAAKTGAAVAAVHHTPKSGTATGMGSQAFDATFDAVLLIEPTTNGGRVEQVKGNTVANWIPPIEWTGEALTMEIDGLTFHAWRPAGQTRAASPKSAGMRKQVRDAWRALCDVSPDGAAVTTDAWFAAFAALAWPVDPPKPDSQKRTFREVARQLVEQGKALKAGEDAWRPAGAAPVSDPAELFAEAAAFA